jgi:hypothetical protein
MFLYMGTPRLISLDAAWAFQLAPPESAQTNDQVI